MVPQSKTSPGDRRLLETWDCLDQLCHRVSLIYSMDALNNRVGAFTEGILTMACPVLLAVALKKVNLSNGESGTTRETISLAVGNLIICLFAFVFLVIAKMLKPLHFESLLKFLYGFSKLLVHVCAILQTVLAYMIFAIKMKFEQSIAGLVVSVLFSLFPLWWCIQSLTIGQEQDEVAYRGFDDKLEQSLDILAAVTSFLFQMLVAMALESQASNDHDHSSLPLGFTFVFCLFATCFMLAGAVLFPIQSNGDEQRKEKCDKLCMVYNGLCLALTILLTVVVPMLTKPSTELAVGMVIFPWIVVGAVFLLLCVANDQAGNQPAASNDEAKPAPLGLTKAIFAGFLAVLIPSFSNGTVSGSTTAFIVITAAVVISGLLWRLLTHLAPMREAVVAADAACLLTQFLVMGAAISFMLMAKDAVAEGNTTCQIPCNNSSLLTPDVILNCFRDTTILHPERMGFVISSVQC